MEYKEKSFRIFLQKWLDDPDDWKETITSLANLMDAIQISENAKAGIKLLLDSIFITQCRKCDDLVAWNWLNSYAQAYLENKELPLFDIGCLTENCQN